MADTLKRLGKRSFKPAHPVFTLGLLAVFVVIIVVVIYLVMQIGTYTFTEPLYYHNTGVRVDLEGESRVFRSEDSNLVSFSLQNNGETHELTDPRSGATAPLYWQDEDWMFLPAMMSVVTPSEGLTPVRTGFYTQVRSNGEGSYTAVIDNREVGLSEGFFFDGQSVYVFLDAVNIVFGGQSYDLPPFSYAIAVAGQRLELYPYEGEPVVQQIGAVQVQALAEDYMIDMSNDILQASGGQYLLFTTPSILEVAQ
ncbi:MAG: hypothetical protein LBL23_06070 [Coriobacteriales bacterium]|jgi:hypothetical protein|nr:hypothetical protein [Coriobacteriales bacterium]